MNGAKLLQPVIEFDKEKLQQPVREFEQLKERMELLPINH